MGCKWNRDEAFLAAQCDHRLVLVLGPGAGDRWPEGQADFLLRTESWLLPYIWCKVLYKRYLTGSHLVGRLLHRAGAPRRTDSVQSKKFCFTTPAAQVQWVHTLTGTSWPLVIGELMQRTHPRIRCFHTVQSGWLSSQATSGAEPSQGSAGPHTDGAPCSAWTHSSPQWLSLFPTLFLHYPLWSFCKKF